VPDQIQLSHLEQTVYFAALRQDIHVLDVERVEALAAISRGHASKLLAAMARKGALYRVGRGRYVVIPSDVLYGRRRLWPTRFRSWMSCCSGKG
jgi:predicted transcriptional regulator of viral defense system